MECFWIVHVTATGIATIDCYPGDPFSHPIKKREIIQRALNLEALGLILLHNHPSGNAYPSAGDRRLTHELDRLLRDLGLVLFDHIIVADGRVETFRDLLLLPRQSKA